MSGPNPEYESFRSATAEDIGTLKQLLLEHGPNEWNHLPLEEVSAHLDGIATGKTRAVLALDNRRVIAMVSFNIGDYYPQYEIDSAKAKQRGYIAEAVVDSGCTGKGLGTMLLEKAKTMLKEMGIETIYIKRHEENTGSAGMMRKAGFQIVDIFPDPIRISGSCRTAVERFRFES